MPICIYNTPQVAYLVIQESGNTTGPILMNYPINRSKFKIIQGINNTLEVFIQNVDHQVSQISSPSSGTVSFNGPLQTVIPSGTQLQTPDNNIFITQASYTIGTSTTIPIVSLNAPGTNYSSTTLTLVTPIQGVTINLIGNISGAITRSVYFNIVNPDPKNNTLLFSRKMNIKDSTRSLYTVPINPTDVLDWECKDYQYSVTVTDEYGNQTILYTDLNYSPYGTITLEKGPFPVPAPVLQMDPTTWNSNNYNSYSPALIGSAQLGYPLGVQTVTFYCNNYTGGVAIYGSLQASPNPSLLVDWFVIDQPYFTNANGPQQVTINGNYLWVMISIPLQRDRVQNDIPDLQQIYVSGNITKILYKN